jgi:hypothetical protein
MSSENIYVQRGKLVTDSSLIPFIRRQDVAFEADNLRPGKIAKLFFDDIAMNGFSQKANRIVLDSKKVISVNSNSSSILAGYYVYQGSSPAVTTFTANVAAYDSSSTTLTISNMSGNFDTSATLYIQNLTSGIITAQANVVSFINANTADIFYTGEGVYSPNNNVYFEVLGTSGENILYVNQNFTVLNIANADVVDVLSTMTNDYQIGDLVYQTTQGKRNPNLATYLGRVVWYNPAVGGTKLVLETIRGTLNTNNQNFTTNLDCRIWNATNTSSRTIQATHPVTIDLQANNIIISVEDPSKKVNVKSHIHNSGVISNTFVNGTDIYINSANASIAVGNLLYFTAGTGMGQIRKVIAVNGNRVTLNLAPTVNGKTSTKYSIGNHVVDENGTLIGILNIPEEPNFKFKTGERIFTITDASTVTASEFTMKASAKFTAGGILNKTQNIVTTPVGQPLPEFNLDNPVAPLKPTERAYNSISKQQPLTDSDSSNIPRVPLADGLSQTFFTPKSRTNKVNNGIFVTSVDLFFKSKPSVANGSLQLPITVRIAQVVNGFPTKNYIASSTVKAKDVKISDSPSVTDSATVTKFTFDDPVYLAPDSEYAFVVSSESPEYELYIAELGGEVLGADPPRRISEQPYAGSLFRAQNSSTWTPYQNEDLMFVINKAVFQTTGSVTMRFSDPPLAYETVDKILLHVNDLSFPSGTIDFKVKGVWKANQQLENSWRYIKPQVEFNYGYLLDQSTNPASSSNNNSRMVVHGNANSFIVMAEFNSTDTDVSPVFNMESVSLTTSQFLVNNAEMSNNIISITNRGIGYLGNATAVASSNVLYGSSSPDQNNAAQLFRINYLNNNANVGLYNVTITGGNGSGAQGFAVANTDGSNTVNYIVVHPRGSGYIENPTISIANGIATVNVRAAAVASGETGKSGGNITAKYLTRQITLDKPSGDLTVYMDAISTPGTDIQVYYKVLGSEDPEGFADKSWVRMHKEVDRKSKNQQNIIELKFRSYPEGANTINKLQYTENGKQYPIGGTFTSFAIKVGLLTSDTSVIPVVKNLRILATPEG